MTFRLGSLILLLGEIYLLISIGAWLGAGWTILWLLVSAAAGITLLRYFGMHLLLQLRDELTSLGQITQWLPIIGALLLIVPGFITDFLGIACLLAGWPLSLTRRRPDGHYSYQHFRYHTQQPKPPWADEDIRPPSGGRIIEGELADTSATSPKTEKE